MRIACLSEEFENARGFNHEQAQINLTLRRNVKPLDPSPEKIEEMPNVRVLEG